MNIDEAVVLKTFAGEAEALIAASRLDAEGIETYIQKDDCGGAYPSLQMSGGVRLFVKPEDRERAERILDEMEAEGSTIAEKLYEQDEPQEAEEEERESTKPDLGRLLRGCFVFLLGLAVGYLVIPTIRNQGSYTGVEKYDWKDGKPGIIAHYGVDGKPTLLKEDRNYDGKPDVRHKYEAGKMTTGKYDNNFDGKWDTWITYKDRFSYVEKVDTDFDAKPDATVYFVNGLTQRRDWHPNDSGKIERRELYEHGLLKEELVDTNRDGIFDRKITYNSYERPINEEKCSIPIHNDRR